MAPRKRKKTTRQKEKNADWMKKRREDLHYRNKGQEDDTVKHKLKRQNPEYRKNEQQRNTAKHQEKRKDSKYKQNEQKHNTRRRQQKRRDPDKSDLLEMSCWNRLLKEYTTLIKDGPTQLCSSCGGLWFEKSLKPVDREYLLKKGCTEELVKCLLFKTNHSRTFELCGTCLNYAMKNQLPRLNLTNGFGFPELPPILTNLTCLEERLVSPRIPFMQIRALGVDQQKGLRGNVVNIENDLDVCCKILPRNMNDTATVQVQLMRRMVYKVPYLYETIRPKAVFDAAIFLCNSELYKQESIILSESWKSKYNGNVCNFGTSSIEEAQCTTEVPMETDGSCHDRECLIDQEFDSDEDDQEQVNPGSQETLILEDGELVKIAPGEGKQPLPWLTDLNAEQLSFPSIYGGIPRKFKKEVKVSYTDIVRSETRMYDRRACKPEKLLYSAKRLQNERVASAINICVRKKKSTANFTAGQLAKDDEINALVGHDDGFRCLRGIRSSSPAFWEQQQKKVLAMIRQTYLPTFFLTLSAAETKWPELLVNLEQVLEGNSISEEQAMNLSYEKKAELIRADPVTCALYFDHRLRCFLNLLVNKKNGVFSPDIVEDHYTKIEFAHRGSAHNHGLFWLKDAPSYNIHDHDSISKCIAFIDQNITCRRDGDEELEKVVVYQIHKHSHTCKQRTPHGSWKCRFNLPLPPMPDTRILTPLFKDSPQYKQAVINFRLLQFRLKEMGRGFKIDIPFIDFLTDLGLNENEKTYVVAIKLYKKRSGPFPTNLSTLLKSLLETAYMVLGLHLTNSSREDTFINTVPEEERVQLLKPQEELKTMDPKSHEIFVSGMLDHYIQRPVELENTCLAEFASTYTFSKSKPKLNALELLDKSGFLKRRLKARIIRYRRYNLAQDPHNYYREQLMLYSPWRNEATDLSKVNIQSRFESKKDVIDANRSPYDPSHGKNGIEELVHIVQEEIENNCSSPNNECDPDYDTDIFQTTGKTKTSKKYEFLMPPKQIHQDQYVNMVRTLNSGQQKYFLHLVHKIKTGRNALHDFVFGSAGVGKSHLITCIVQFLLPHLTKDPGYNLDSIPVLVCAPTGKAAFNIFGMTLHAAFALPPNKKKRNLKEFPIAALPDDICNTLRVKYKNLKLVIIDEISMVSVVQLFQINARLQQIMGNQLPFGGVSILVVGDFYQIRPYKAQFVFQVPKNIPFGYIIGNELWSHFSMYELTQIMRQDKALQFAQALNNMAKGCMTEDDIKLIKSREISNGLIPPAESLHLFWSNEECLRHNTEVHEALSTEWAISEAFDVIHGNATDLERANFLEYVKSLPAQETDGLASKVRLQVGAQYMVSTNVNVSDGIFNGSTGEIVHILYSLKDNGEKIPTKIFMKFDCPVVGSETRASDTSAKKHGFDMTLTPIGIYKKPLNMVGYNQGITVYRSQIPVLAANGITITKSQGASRHYIVLHYRPGLTRDLLYVGCSRTFTPDGLFIEGSFNPPGPPPQYITDEIERLRANPLELSIRFLQDTNDDNNKLIFHNVQSLNKHYLDILADHSFMSSDVMCFVEPWTLRGDSYEFKNYPYTRREDCSSVRNSYGSYISSKLSIESYKFESQYTSNNHFSITSWNIDNVCLCMIYKSPAYSLQLFIPALDHLLQSLQNKFTIVFGDFNINLFSNNELLNLFAKYGFQLSVPLYEFSTDGGTQIDLCFSNFTEMECWYYESIFSYHKPLCIIWPKGSQCLTMNSIDVLMSSITKLALDANAEQSEKSDMQTNQSQSEISGLHRNEDKFMEVETKQLQLELPTVTITNAGQPYLHVHGITLSLNDLKTLSRCTYEESQIFRQVAKENCDIFVENYLTDAVVYASMCSITVGTSSIVIAPGVVTLILTSNYQLMVQEGEWDRADYVYMPIHFGNHWMLLVVQPKAKSIQFYDPASANLHACTTGLISQITNILKAPNLLIEVPNKCHQQDGFNCGVYICNYVLSITSGANLTQEFDPSNFRQELLQLLWNNSEEYLIVLQ